MTIGPADGILASQARALAADAAPARAAEELARSAGGGRSADAAKRFEALFATMLVKEMRRSLPEGFFGGETAGEVYGGWFDQHMGEMLARRGDLHLAEAVERSLGTRKDAPPEATTGMPTGTEAAP